MSLPIRITHDGEVTLRLDEPSLLEALAIDAGHLGDELVVVVAERVAFRGHEGWKLTEVGERMVRAGGF